jgi:hypothetical protein
LSAAAGGGAGAAIATAAGAGAVVSSSLAADAAASSASSPACATATLEQNVPFLSFFPYVYLEPAFVQKCSGLRYKIEQKKDVSLT